jgi:type III secretory pathway component EscV
MTQPPPDDRRDPAKGRAGDRRRTSWSDFRRAYPGFVATLVVGLLLLLAVDGFLIYKRRAYDSEVARLRGQMTESEREKTDAIVKAEENKTLIALALARRQAKIEKALHLSVAIDSGRIYLEREGAILREIPARFGPERVIAQGADSIPIVIPRGQRRVVRVTDDRIVLEGGTGIQASPSDALANDSTAIPAGDVRIGRADMNAIRPNLSEGMRVYFY